MTAKLTPAKKLEWAKKQRIEGNRLFAKMEYKEAMDVYLTCFVAMDKLPSSDNETRDEKLDAHNTDDEEHPSVSKKVLEEELQLPVLLNLSLCTLKLGFFRKTQQFCNIALELPSGRMNAKVYFRRGKARMLMGLYHSSRLDFDMALKILSNDATGSGASKNVEMEQKSVLTEMKKLERLERSAKSNSKKQKKAMQTLLGGDQIKGKDVFERDQIPTIHSQNTANEKRNQVESNDNEINELEKQHLYHEKGLQHEYSNLRAKSKESDDTLSNEYGLHKHNMNHRKIGFFVFIFVYLMLASVYQYLTS